MRKLKKGRSSSERSDTSDKGEFETLDEYEASAKYYDIWTEDFRDDIDFYVQLIETAGPPILVCMCGTGRVLIPLAKKGYEVTGVDRSSAMLDRCAEKIELLDEKTQERIDIIQGDVRSFKTSKRFKLVILPYNSFMHLLDTADQEEALRNISAHMAGDGLLTIAIINPKFSKVGGALYHAGTKLTPEGEIISRFESWDYDLASQRIMIHYFYDISRQDRPLRRVTTTFTLRYSSYREMVELLKRCDFDVLDVYGDYAFSPFKKDSELMIFLARKMR
ncbi:MAG: class I SAM-dependent methyltransferase [Methanomassiliicoccales archaeon]|jgi:SAM-dependent methyltransferase|nr:class I SAM-dependent methyltransferase [Methanomassiliicoccales archaeon]